MSNKRRLLSLVAATAVATTTAGLVSVGAANAAAGDVLGALSISPLNGTQSSAMTFSTPNGVKCPAGTASVDVIITGQTLTEDNPGIITGSTDYSLVAHPSNNDSVPGGVTMASVFADNAITSPSGSYQYNLQCLDGNGQETGRFTAVTTWTATGGNFNGSYATAVPPTASTTVLSGPTTSVAGGSITLTATVSPSNATGSVTFKDGATTLGTSTVGAGGVATYTTSSLSVGSHGITADYTPTGNFTASSSNTLTHTVSKLSTSTTLSSNGPTAQYAPAVFTATVSPAAAGTVTFKDGAATLGSAPVASGTATFSTTSLAGGPHSVTASFVPSNPAAVDPSDSSTVTHNVTAFAGASVTEHVIVEVPAGALTMVIDTTPGSAPDGNADGNVDLGTASMDAAGEKLTASGEMDPVKITDTRAGDPGWTASGIVTNFAHGTDEVNGFNLGWTPSIVGGPSVGLSANQQGAFVLGSPVAAGTEATPSSTPGSSAVGLKASRTLGVAPDNSGNGTARLGAHLDLNIPTDVPAGVYGATLTLTVI
ncbi:Ig-like domain repeat protein [Marmoricola sp. RAF53]|uniref:Ig-like domain repeat protein n=1 Tax=Marmoricola sp. RAF53 TaxID=3233059 RepID=UPI003F96267A